MARTLSDALIIAMIEATTRLASARSSGAKPPSAEGTDAPKDGASKEAPESRTAEQLGDDFATIYKTLGINHRAKHFLGSRPIWATPEGSKPISALL